VVSRRTEHGDGITATTGVGHIEVAGNYIRLENVPLSLNYLFLWSRCVCTSLVASS